MTQRVLIVDDEVQILRALRMNLEARGYLVTTFRTARRPFASCATNHRTW